MHSGLAAVSDLRLFHYYSGTPSLAKHFSISAQLSRGCQTWSQVTADPTALQIGTDGSYQADDLNGGTTVVLWD